MKRFLALLTIFIGCGHPAQGIEVGGPTHDGVEVQVDMPLSLRKHNIGSSVDGAGLCVQTSIQNAARVQHVTALEEFQHFMASKPGGGYPSKEDAMIAACCKEQGVPTVRYLQYQGTDPTPIKLALQAGRMPCITYDGRDKVHYSGHIEHMINCVYMDDARAAVLDNNFIGDNDLVWLTIPEFTSRWIGGQGRQGWMVLLLDPGVPPVPSVPKPVKGDGMNALLLSAATLLAAPGYDTSFAQYAPQPVAGARFGGCPSCGTGGCPSCSSGSCPTCPGGICPNCPPAASSGTRYLLHRLDGSYVPCDAQGVPLDAPAKAAPPKSGCKCGCDCKGCSCRDSVRCADPDCKCNLHAAAGDDAPTPNFGLVPSKMSDIEHWTLDGTTVPRREGFEAIRAGAPDLPNDKALPWLIGYGLDAPTEALLHTAKGVRAVNYPLGSAMALDRDGRPKWLAGAVCVANADCTEIETVQPGDVADLVGRLNKLPDGYDPTKLPDLLHPKPAPKPVDPTPDPANPDAPADASLPIALVLGFGFLALTGGAATAVTAIPKRKV